MRTWPNKNVFRAINSKAYPLANQHIAMESDSSWFLDGLAIKKWWCSIAMLVVLEGKHTHENQLFPGFQLRWMAPEHRFCFSRSRHSLARHLWIVWLHGEIKRKWWMFYFLVIWNWSLSTKYVRNKPRITHLKYDGCSTWFSYSMLRTNKGQSNLVS